MNIGLLMAKDGSGQTCLLTFPHESEENRNTNRVEFCRYLGPHSFMRFFPHIAFSQGRKDLPFSYLGDVWRPKQFVRHKYRNLKTQFSEEELLESTTSLVSDKVFGLRKDLVFISSFEESFYAIFLALQQALAAQDSKSPLLLILFSPFVYLSTHYQGINIRGESFLRKIVEKIEEQDNSVHILLIGSQNRTINPVENSFLEGRRKWIEVIEAEAIDRQFCSTFAQVINERFSDHQKICFFSCNTIPSMFFPGKSFVNSDSPLDNRLALILFRQLGFLQHLRSLSVHDYNPQIEDYASGVFLSTLVFEFLNKKYRLLS